MDEVCFHKLRTSLRYSLSLLYVSCAWIISPVPSSFTLLFFCSFLSKRVILFLCGNVSRISWWLILFVSTTIAHIFSDIVVHLYFLSSLIVCLCSYSALLGASAENVLWNTFTLHLIYFYFYSIFSFFFSLLFFILFLYLFFYSVYPHFSDILLSYLCFLTSLCSYYMSVLCSCCFYSMQKALPVKIADSAIYFILVHVDFVLAYRP